MYVFKILILLYCDFKQKFCFRTCSCPIGRSKSFCKHKNAVITLFNISTLEVLPGYDPTLRSMVNYIATGKMPKFFTPDRILVQKSMKGSVKY